MHQQFYIIIFQVHLPDACHTASNAILVKHDGRDALVAEQLEVCHLISGQVEGTLPHLQPSLIFRAAVHAPASGDIVIFSEAAPLGVDDDKAFQQTIRDDLQLRQQGRTAELSVVHDALDCQKVVPVDDGFMVILIMTLGLFSPVLEGLLVVDIRCELGEPLAGQHISAVALVPHTGRYTGCRPLQIAPIRPLAQLREGVCNLLGGISV